MDETTAGLAMLAGQLAFTNNQLLTRVKNLEAELEAAKTEPQEA